MRVVGKVGKRRKRKAISLRRFRSTFNSMDEKMMKNLYSLRPHQLLYRLFITVAGVVLMAGCAGTPPPLEQMATSRAAVNSAGSTGANEFAPLQLKSAIEKMNAAERAMAERDYELARQLAEQAQVDAQLAGAITRSAKARKAADAVQEDSRVLRQEIERKTK